jgi:hypothetical protein
MLFALGEPGCRDATWFGFWDADFATPLSEVDHLLAYANLFDGPVDAVFGSRVYKLGSCIRRKWHRHLIGRFFATLFHRLFHTEAYDTQCGAKLFLRSRVESTFAAPFMTRWIFDVEIILRLRQFRVVECPVRKWIDKGGSKLCSVKAWATIIGDIHRLWRHYPSS